MIYLISSNKIISIGYLIRNIRIRMGLTQEEFGSLFSPIADKSIVSRWEKDKSLPNPKRLKFLIELEQKIDTSNMELNLEDILGAQEAIISTNKIDILIENELNRFSDLISQKKIETADLSIFISRTMAQIEGIEHMSNKELNTLVKKNVLNAIDYFDKTKQFFPKNQLNSILFSVSLVENTKKKLNKYFKRDYLRTDDSIEKLKEEFVEEVLDYNQYSDIYDSLDSISKQIEQKK